ncbi:MAG: hypothetical protein ACOVVP_08960, partial [Pseudanabaena sp.]
MIDPVIFSHQNSFAALEVGKHFYWQFGNLAVHGQVLIVSWIVMGVVLVAAIIGSSTAKADQRVPAGFQNFMEYALNVFQSIFHEILKTNVFPRVFKISWNMLWNT